MNLFDGLAEVALFLTLKKRNVAINPSKTYDVRLLLDMQVFNNYSMSARWI